MNTVKVTRAKSNDVKKMAEDVVFWCYNKLLPHHSTIHVDIDFKHIRQTGYDGLCEWQDTNVAPREFKITVHKGFGKKNIIQTIIHEMIHVKQYAKGELAERYRGGHTQYWNGVDHNETEYEDQPWEIEAHSLEDALYEEYINYINSYG